LIAEIFLKMSPMQLLADSGFNVWQLTLNQFRFHRNSCCYSIAVDLELPSTKDKRFYMWYISAIKAN